MVQRKRSSTDPDRFVRAIKQSGLTIYDPIVVGDVDLWIPTPELEDLLNSGLLGQSLAGLPLRTRSKVVKELVCEALGYPTPATFKKTQPRFPGQLFDTYVQKSNNLQIWNEELSPTRRYVLIRVSSSDVICRVKVVTGQALAILDTTGTLTQKYQARCIPGSSLMELITAEDTSSIKPHVATASRVLDADRSGPIDPPQSGQLLSIGALYARLGKLVGTDFQDVGVDQERNRGAALHKLVCEALGYPSYQDAGQFPDVRHQLLEVKLQTSPTIDLGLVLPSSKEPLDVPMLGNTQIRHCDVRYAVFYAKVAASRVTLTHLFLSTGEGFLKRFPQFQGKVLNAKLQIPLPAGFFDD